MAPLTRCRAEGEHVPGAPDGGIYAQRAAAGLIIAEATMAMACNSAFWSEPGGHSLAGPGRRLAARVVDAFIAKGGRIALQEKYWHGGRACHPLMNHGAPPVAPSAIAITGDEVRTPEGKKPYVGHARCRMTRSPGLSRDFAWPPKMRSLRGLTASKCMAPMAICSMNFCATAPTGGVDLMAATKHRAALMFAALAAVSTVWGPIGSGFGCRCSTASTA